ncbi:Trp biosynthesis-associated membrane protein [Mycetocola reblochoni]|uniref:Tryptophan-associated membrane protein n=2 Tax=Mycetocola reblochoni TaxID=331618 RepID=A0A1R4J4C3_9MICO|nr:Trp biosynthesis-associated membrane protein [Mycetocola reblochoni]RLP69528.1 peptidase [Mycetocola reblochoni]SJN26888.1 Tryptophan-associated membrane protein [Mycetocola reblochoni REB411]
MSSASRTPATRRIKSLVLLVTLVTSGLALIGATQQWYAVTIEPEPGVVESLPADGQTLLPVLAGLGLTGLALVAALALVGRVWRVVLGVVLTLTGLAVTVATATVLSDPGAAAAPAVTERTGIAGAESVARIVTGAQATPWPWLTLVCGALLIIAGAVVVVSASRWPTATRKYDASPRGTTVRSGPVDAIDGWDELSRGEDPTR